MIFTESVDSLRKKINKWKGNGNIVSFVPTMGNLHEGHIKLIDTAKSISDKIVVSIFVNPMQFDRIEDFRDYPRSFKEDYKILIDQNLTDLLFVPNIETIYPNNFLKNKNKQTFLEVPVFKNFLEWKVRPNHFRGVSTVVSKFFNIINPNIAIFGKKDFQQLLVVKRLVKDMCYSIKIIGVPTVRDMYGLAYSSRNTLLNKREKKIASNLYFVLKNCKNSILLGERNSKILIEQSKSRLIQLGLKPDKIEILDYHTLQSISKNTKKVVILFSVWIRTIRLIDNIIIELI